LYWDSNQNDLSQMEPMSEHESEFDEAMLKLNEIEKRIEKLELLNQIDKANRYLIILLHMIFEYFIKGVKFPNWEFFMDEILNKSCDEEEGIITKSEYDDWCKLNSPAQIDINDFIKLIPKCYYDTTDIDVRQQEEFLRKIGSFAWPLCDNFSYDIITINRLIKELKSVPKYRRIINPK
jgi:hypothetical protein